MSDTESLIFSSVLDECFHKELESLLFFNPNQGQYAGTISKTIELFGNPQILIKDGLLRVSMQSNTQVQSLYILLKTNTIKRLVGVVIYTLQPADTLNILHLAVNTEFAAFGKKANRMVVLEAINRLRQIARRIKGVAWLKFSYGTDLSRNIRIR